MALSAIPQHVNTEESVLKATVGYAKEATGGFKNLVLKPAIYAIEAAKHSGWQDPIADHVQNDLKVAKRLVSIPEGIGQLYDVGTGIYDMCNGSVSKGALKAVKNLFYLTDPATEVTKLVDSWVGFLNDSTRQIVGLVGSTGLLIGSAWDGVENITKLVDSANALQKAPAGEEGDKIVGEEKARIVHSSLGLAKKICYIALAALSIISLVFAITFSPWIGLALSVGALALTLTTFFTDKAMSYKARPETPTLPPSQPPVDPTKIAP